MLLDFGPGMFCVVVVRDLKLMTSMVADRTCDGDQQPRHSSEAATAKRSSFSSGPPHSESAWLGALQGARHWSPQSPKASAVRSGWVVVAPHPDDETLGAGGLIARLARRGEPIRQVLVTAGEAAEVAISDLAERRRVEHRNAMTALGAGHVPVIDLNLPDGRVAEHENGLTEQLVEIGRALSKYPLALIGPLAHDGHPDHEATARACRAASARLGCPLLEYPIWAWERFEIDAFPVARAQKLMLLSSERTRKARAVACFKTQISPPVGPAVLPPAVLKRFARSFETFVAHRPGSLVP